MLEIFLSVSSRLCRIRNIDSVVVNGFVSHPLLLVTRDITRCCVKIKGTLEGDVRTAFSAHGSVSKVSIPMDRATVSNFY
jgi:hypothetical protein